MCVQRDLGHDVDTNLETQISFEEKVKQGRQLKIAVSGKGGVGKTLVAGALASCLASRGLKTMAIDADSSPNLALTLGLSPAEARKIVPISENKQLLESKTSTEYEGVYRLSFTVDDIVREYSVQTPFDVNLIVMGTVKSMGSGCACPANAVVRALLSHLVVDRREAVILDMEAGVEHMGRGTAKRVDIMLIVVDAGIKSLEIAKHIHELAVGGGMKKVFLIGNKIDSEKQRDVVKDFAEKNGLAVLDFVPFDQKIVEAEVQAETPLRQKDSAALQVINKLCEKLVTGGF